MTNQTLTASQVKTIKSLSNDFQEVNQDQPYDVAEAIAELACTVRCVQGELSWGELHDEVIEALSELEVSIEDVARNAQDFAEDCDESHERNEDGELVVNDESLVMFLEEAQELVNDFHKTISLFIAE